MQSSPPEEQAWQRPSSPAMSQYALDLAVLDPDSPNGASTPFPEPRIDIVASEDIDGPSDFTLRLGEILRGGSIARTRNAGTLHRRPLSRDNALLGPQEHRASALHTAPALSTAPASENAADDDDRTMSHHTPTNSPPRDSVLLSSLRNFETQKPGASPTMQTSQPPNQFLQACVEDYQSELSLARPTSTTDRQYHKDPNHHLSNTEEHQKAGSISPTPTRMSPAFSLVDSPKTPEAATRRFSPSSDQTSLEEYRLQIQELEARCEQVDRLNSALKDAVAEERRLRNHDLKIYDAKLQEASEREQQFIESQRRSDRHADALQEEFDNLKDHLDQVEAQQSSRENRPCDYDRVEMRQQREATISNALEDLRQRHAKELQTLREQFEQERAEHEKALEFVKNGWELTRRTRDAAEASARSAWDEVENVKAEESSTLERLKLDLINMENLKAQLQDSQEQLRVVRLENAELVVKHTGADKIVSDLRAQLSTNAQTEHDRSKRGSSEFHRAIDLSEGLQRMVEELQRQLSDEQAAHCAQVERLQKNAVPVSNSINEELQTLRDDMEAKQSLLNNAVIERDERQDEVERLIVEAADKQRSFDGMVKELKAARDDLMDVRAVNSQLDLKFSDTLRRREEYWRGRVDEDRKERMIMTKALMDSWGRQDVGSEEPLQRYVYKYLKQHEPPRDGMKSSR